LQKLQRQTLLPNEVPITWHHSMDEIPDGPTIILANEFIDALPVHQAVMCADGWHERVVKIDEDGNLRFSIDRDPIPLFDEFLPSGLRSAKIGEIFEWRAEKTALELGRRIVRGSGAALIIDYGHTESAIGDTLQAVSRHGFADPLKSPGLVDLTAHVDFQALAQTVEGVGARVHGPITQAEFLRRLGIEQRAAALRSGAPQEYVAAIDAALQRLTNEEGTGMGRLIKAMALSSPPLDHLPPFDS
jgi:SAM-dependent MidA family methyltransferase